MGQVPESVCGSVDGVQPAAGSHCADVMVDVWRFLDDELDPGRRAAVQRHLDECSPCLEEAGIDTKLKELLARKCGGDQAPAQLRQRIAAAVVAWREDGETGVAVTASVTIAGETLPE